MIPALSLPPPHALLAATPPTLQLFTSEPPAQPPTVLADHWSMILWIAAGVFVLGVSAAVSIMAWRGRWRDPPITRALNTLASALHLRADAKAVLQRLAQALGAEPIAFLLSESAFNRAVTALEAQGGPLDQRDKAALLALHAKVFGNPHESINPHFNTTQTERENPPLNIAA